MTFLLIISPVSLTGPNMLPNNSMYHHSYLHVTKYKNASQIAC